VFVVVVLAMMVVFVVVVLAMMVVFALGLQRGLFSLVQAVG